MNDNDSLKLGGGAPTASKLYGQVAPTAQTPPPTPGSRVPESVSRVRIDKALKLTL